METIAEAEMTAMKKIYINDGSLHRKEEIYTGKSGVA